MTREEEWMKRNGLKYNDSGVSIYDKTPVSIIKWKTGKPKEFGEYLVTLQDGSIQVDSWEYDVICDEEGIPFWRLYTYNVTAWCKLSDIEPYKEE